MSERASERGCVRGSGGFRKGVLRGSLTRSLLWRSMLWSSATRSRKEGRSEGFSAQQLCISAPTCVTYA
eukprot:3331415-Pyramimonas_sp.AAC.1